MENGRQLKNLSNGSTRLDLKYDTGVRTEKTFISVTTKYTLFGDKVSFETTGSYKIHYGYNASGNLFFMKLNGSGVAGFIAAQSLSGALVDADSGAGAGAVNHRLLTGSWKGVGNAALNGSAV